jgi:N-glycosylase/DNA lyase
MRTKEAEYNGIDLLRARFEERKEAIRSRLDEFAGVTPEEYFYELVYCLLTPQSSALNAAKAVEALKKADLFSKHIHVAPLLRDKRFYIRFHNTKARHLNEAKSKFDEITVILSNGSTSTQLREWLVGNVKGFGWKEASHFLRNIGYRDLAILDRHILRNLKKYKVMKTIPRSLTPRRYRAIEAKFAQFAKRIGITIDELDILFWSEETGEILK